MQLRLPWLSPAVARERLPREVIAGGRAFPVTIARHRWARRYVLRVTEAGAVRLTVPRGASIAEGLRFAAGQASWIEGEWSRLVDRRSWSTGTLIWYRGEQVPLDVSAAGITWADVHVPVSKRIEDPRAIVQRYLRETASADLPARCRALGAPHGLSPSRVTIRDQRSRWGACSSKGAITLNWRLVQMPPAVADYVMLHELAHLRQPNHSRKFWREVASICEQWRAAEQWLKRHGKELM